MKFNTPTQTALYTIEHAIKAYRKFCQQNISEKIKDITVDQTLVLLIINDRPKLNQKEIAELVFKDYASMTRMIELMVKKEYLVREINPDDRRRFTLNITDKGKKAIEILNPIIQYNRTTALKGLSDTELVQLFNTLTKIISNCQS